MARKLSNIDIDIVFYSSAASFKMVDCSRAAERVDFGNGISHSLLKPKCYK
jgi:hypothetical protein